MHKLFYSISIIAILAGLTLALTGCGKKPTAGKIVIWNAIDSQEIFQPLLDEYSSKAKVEFSYIHKSEWQANPWLYETEMLNALATGQGPDIVTIPNDWIPKHFDKAVPAPEQTFAQLDKKYKKLSNTQYLSQFFVPTVVLENVIDNKVYGLPFYVDSLALFCNRKLFDEAAEKLKAKERNNPILSETELKQAKKILSNYPRTWSEILKAIELIKKTTVTEIDQPAIALGAASNVPNAVDILVSLMLQNGAQVTTYDLKSAAFHLEQSDTAALPYPGRDALSFLSRFATSSDPYYTWNKDQQNAEAMFLDGKLPMLIADSSFKAKAEQKMGRQNQPQVVGFPQIDEQKPRVAAKYWTNIVTTNSQNVEAAWNFLAWASQEKTLRAYLKTAKRPSPLKAESNVLSPATDPFEMQAQYALGWYKGRNPQAADKIISEMIDKAPSQRADLGKLMDTYANKFTEMLQTQSPPPNSLFSQPVE